LLKFLIVFQQPLAAQVLSRLIGKLEGVRLKEGSEKHRSLRKSSKIPQVFHGFPKIAPCQGIPKSLSQG
jgi:hypothetical protein